MAVRTSTHRVATTGNANVKTVIGTAATIVAGRGIEPRRGAKAGETTTEARPVRENYSTTVEVAAVVAVDVEIATDTAAATPAVLAAEVVAAEEEEEEEAGTEPIGNEAPRRRRKRRSRHPT